MSTIPELSTLDVQTLSRLLTRGEISSVEIVRSCLQSIEKQNPVVNAFIEVFADSALEEARQSDLRRKEGRALSVLDGIPVGIKDNFLIQGKTCSCAGKMLEHFIAPYEATAVKRLRMAGMPILGRLNMDEFAMGCTTETSLYGPVHNPHHNEHTAGGSSGGSAAAVAAHMVPCAIGSDTGGSIRQPASFCGVVGVKPAYGTISRYGLVAFASSLDTVGILAQNAGDAELLMPILAGRDEKDATSLDNLCRKTVFSPKKLTALIPRECFGNYVQPAVEQALRRAGTLLEKNGVTLREISMPALPYALAAYHVLSAAEASSNLARYDGIRYGYRTPSATGLDSLYRKSREEGFGSEVKKRIRLGCFVLNSSNYESCYAKAAEVRTQIRLQLDQMLNEDTVLFLPTSPVCAPLLGRTDVNPQEQYACDSFTVPANLSGLPAVSVPFGRNEQGLPIGLQLMGCRAGLNILLKLAGMLEGGAEP